MLDLKKRFTYCGPFHDGAAFVSTKATTDELPNQASFWEDMCKELQYINKQGEVIFKIKDEWGIKCGGEFRNGFSSGLLKVTKKERQASGGTQIGYIDKTGQLKIPFIFRGESNADETFSEGLAGMGIRSNLPNVKKPVIKYGYINQLGEWQIPPTFTKVYPFKHGAAMVLDTVPNSKHYLQTYLIDKKGNRIFSAEIETYARLHRDSLLAVFKVERTESGSEKHSTRRYAIAKTNGTLTTDFIFTIMQPGVTSQDLWIASLPDNDKKIGFVDDEGSLIIPYQYPKFRTYFEDGLAVVYTDKKASVQAVINKKGEFVIPPDTSTNYQIDGVIVSPNDDGGIFYYNREGQRIDFKDYERYGLFQHLPLAD